MTLARAVSFTASRDMDEAARQGVVTSVLAVHVPFADRYVTGACVGGDAFIGRWLYANRPDAEHAVVVPADRSRVDTWWLEAKGPAVTVTEMPPGTTYADRNARLVGAGRRRVRLPVLPRARSPVAPERNLAKYPHEPASRQLQPVPLREAPRTAG